MNLVPELLPKIVKRDWSDRSGTCIRVVQSSLLSLNPAHSELAVVEAVITYRCRSKHTVWQAVRDQTRMNEMMDQNDLAALETQREDIVHAARTVIIAAGGGGMPELGVTPMVRHDRSMYIYPSRLSAHVRLLLEQGQAQFMMIQDEGDAQNIWARKRIKFNARVIEIDRYSDDFTLVSERFTEVHGPTMNLIRDFSDFHMLRLVPTSGVMVLGFAKAFELNGADLTIVSHLRES